VISFKQVVRSTAIVVAILSVAVARADVFNMGSGVKNLEMVPVGDAGNHRVLHIVLHQRGDHLRAVAGVDDPVQQGRWEYPHHQAPVAAQARGATWSERFDRWFFGELASPWRARA